MLDVVFIWNEEPGGNVEHIADNNLYPEDIECAYETALRFGISRSSGRQIFYGQAGDDSEILVVYEELDATTWYVVTAYRVGEEG
ncbi:MAG: hypothetical protein ETSY1_31275 [Candidatus Entotheonella factor]|uniref:DUF4258 domain-containing protein n=1 Tax=Entotheonella factor TaxID=1429438 RepID=W4LBL9_ENTF1|nr:hypothetical protein [Candidatus Entotheonella palauensis]ETW95289.1 MAG: hypothetical protein ETSY1_31275 [Candidatus Entotheonella factor]